MSAKILFTFLLTISILAFSVLISAQEVYEKEDVQVYDNCVGCSQWMRENSYPANSRPNTLSKPTGRIGTEQNVPILERNKRSKENEADINVVPAACVITNITDGDTFDCYTESIEVTVRLIGVDTPELNTPEGKIAKSFLVNLLPVGTTVILEFDAQILDKYQRVLAYVWINDRTMLNELLLNAGHASIMTVPPNVKYVERFTRIKNNQLFEMGK